MRPSAPAPTSFSRSRKVFTRCARRSRFCSAGRRDTLRRAAGGAFYPRGEGRGHLTPSVRLNACPTWRCSRLPTSFNSTLVRLRPVRGLMRSSSATCFNSTLVRLRHVEARAQRARTVPCFNSTLVRLRPTDLASFEASLSDKFQFHSGSIKTESGAWSFNSLYGFNSTLVRLRPRPAKRSEACRCGFNSTLVRLRLVEHHFGDFNHLVSIPLWFD